MRSVYYSIQIITILSASYFSSLYLSTFSPYSSPPPPLLLLFFLLSFVPFFRLLLSAPPLPILVAPLLLFLTPVVRL